MATGILYDSDVINEINTSFQNSKDLFSNKLSQIQQQSNKNTEGMKRIARTPSKEKEQNAMLNELEEQKKRKTRQEFACAFRKLTYLFRCSTESSQGKHLYMESSVSGVFRDFSMNPAVDLLEHKISGKLNISKTYCSFHIPITDMPESHNSLYEFLKECTNETIPTALKSTQETIRRGWIPILTTRMNLILWDHTTDVTSEQQGPGSGNDPETFVYTMIWTAKRKQSDDGNDVFASWFTDREITIESCVKNKIPLFKVKTGKAKNFKGPFTLEKIDELCRLITKYFDFKFLIMAQYQAHIQHLTELLKTRAAQ